jgi:hypothetical protein
MLPTQRPLWLYWALEVPSRTKALGMDRCTEYGVAITLAIFESYKSKKPESSLKSKSSG